MKRGLRWLMMWLVLGLALWGGAIPAGASPAQQSVPAGGVVQLAGTPHLWVSWNGTLHWAGDTRAIEGRYVNWADRREVPLSELRRYPIGDPWLSTGLVKIGDPIYLAKWETHEGAPTLLHIPSIGDVELFGINGTNYGAMVQDAGAWEARTGFRVASLARGALSPAAQPTAAPTRVPPTATARPQPTATPQAGYNGWPVVPVMDPSLPTCSDVIGTAIFRNRGNPDAARESVRGVRCYPVDRDEPSAPSPSQAPRPSDSDVSVRLLSLSGTGSFPTLYGEACNRNRDWRATDVRIEFEFYNGSSTLPTLDSGSYSLSEVRANSCQTFNASLTALNQWTRVAVKRVSWTWRPK